MATKVHRFHAARFRDRHQAGQALARALQPHLREPAILYALPRGGVPVAVEIALACVLPLDLVIARKIGHPHQPEYAIGAVTETGEAVFNQSELESAEPGWLEQQVAEQRAEARRRRRIYSSGHPRRSASGRCAILVDDGIATGLTMLAAIAEIRQDRPTRIVVAVPVAPADTAERFAAQVDRFVAARVPEFFAGAVGNYYDDFRQLSDQDVLDELHRLPQLAAASAVPGPP